MRTNFHTHTYRCKHAGGTEEEYVQEAISKGLGILGFSDHAPFPDDRYGLRMDFSELQPYIKAVEDLKASKKEFIKVFTGLEIEYDPREHAYYEKLLRDYHLDYLALAQHFYMNKVGEAVNIYSADSTAHYIAYANSIVEGMASGYFSFVAHPDLMFVNNLAWDENCEQACDIIINAAKAHDYILEFNANGFRRGYHDFVDGRRLMYPHKRFWDKVSGSNIRVVIGSDCHGPEQIFDEIIEAAHQAARHDWNLNLIDNIFA
ncbi:MAG: histidinol-phosphatase [Clostridia bacterium]|nr:histidinol-phosphatase [Clostridia bacterium]